MNFLNPVSPLVEISRIATHGDCILELGGPAWCAEEQECRRWFRSGTRFFMYDARGRVLDVYLDERSFLTTVPTWRTNGDSPVLRQLLQLPRIAEAGPRPAPLAV